jgi:hypothetical protein
MSDKTWSDSDVEPIDDIGGWLVLPFLFLITVAFVVTDYLLDSRLPGLRPEVMAGNLAVLVGSVVMLVLFLQRRRSVPALMVVFYVVLVAVCVLEVSTLTRFSDGIPDELVRAELKDARDGLGMAMGNAILWIPYFLVSKRVRRTFVT